MLVKSKFNYASAMQRVEMDLVGLADKLWESKGATPSYPCESTREKVLDLKTLSDPRGNTELTKLSMLDELLHESFWHAADSLLDPCLWPNLTEKDRDLYLRAVLHQARNSPSKMGYGTILRKYDEEKQNGQERLRGYVDETDLTDLVTRAFCEFAVYFYTTSYGLQAHSERYDLIEKYFKYVDFSRTKGLWTDKPLVSSDSGWPTLVYKDAFEDARKNKNLDEKLGAWLAHPILDQIIRHAIYAEDRGLIEAHQSLENYCEYLDDPLVQSLFKKWLVAPIDSLKFGNSRRAALCVDFLFEYILYSSEDEKKKMICELLPKDADLYKYLIDEKFPVRLLTGETLCTVRDQLLAKLDAECLDKENLLKFIDLAKDATLTNFLDQEIGQRLLKSALVSYSNLKPRPSSDLSLGMQYKLDKLFESGLIVRREYLETGRVCVSDLRFRKKTDLADQIERKLKAVEEGATLLEVKKQLEAERAAEEALRRRSERERHGHTRARQTRRRSHNDAAAAPGQSRLDQDFTNLDDFRKLLRKRSP